MPYKIGVTTGLYSIARTEELATTVRKVGFALTRGTSVIEISGDVPHEITETDGKELRYIARKQGLELLFHGSLTVPMCMPERADWRDAHDHMQKSVRSAVFSGCKYVLFHACLNIWLELMTYAGRKLTMAFVDQEGHFISRIMAKSRNLREWFLIEKWREYYTDIVSPSERAKVGSRAEIERIDWLRTREEELRKRAAEEKWLQPKYETERERLRSQAARVETEVGERLAKEMVRGKLANEEKWYKEELRAVVGIIDGYHIMANYIFFENDPIWTEIEKFYSSVLKNYNLDRSDLTSVDRAWEKAERENDREFKEFYYGVVGAKFLEGHIKKLLEWMNNDLMTDLKDEKLKEIARNLQITIEIPDARDPTHAGLHLFWRPNQIYAAIKTIRKVLKTDRVWMTMDFEHVATQGLDPIKELEKTIETAPDFGDYILSVHSNAPNPMHAHEPLELGDVRVYKLLWFLRKSGFGKTRKGIILYERGGAKDPFQKAVDVLRLCVDSLEKGIHPDELPMEFFGMKGPVAGDIRRQSQIVRDHAWEPMKDLLEIPEEEWTMLSQAVIKKGKKPEVWKRGEFR